jgi:hypothetical protein
MCVTSEMLLIVGAVYMPRHSQKNLHRKPMTLLENDTTGTSLAPSETLALEGQRMRLNRVFIGKYEPIRRPVNAVDGSLLGRIQKAKRDLTARGKDVVAVREMHRSTKAVPFLLPTKLHWHDRELNEAPSLIVEPPRDGDRIR